MLSRTLAASAAIIMLTLAGAGASNATVVGPDTFGYVGTDQVSGYVFNDIRTTGTKILAGLDDSSQQVDMGMSFRFYGGTYTSAYLTTNGLVTFTGGNTTFNNYDITTAQVAGGPSIATYWDDLYTQGSTDAGIYYQTLGNVVGQRQFVVQTVANRYGYGGAVINFETVLDEASGDVLMRYTQTSFGSATYDMGASATVGIQGSQALGQFVQWSNNQAVLRNNETLCFTQSLGAACSGIVPPTVGAVPEPASWAMMIAGFGAVGSVMRRRKVAVGFA